MIISTMIVGIMQRIFIARMAIHLQYLMGIQCISPLYQIRDTWNYEQAKMGRGKSMRLRLRAKSICQCRNPRR
jgi:hypothetical protein